MFSKKVEPKKEKSNGQVTRATNTHEGVGIKAETGQPKASDHIQRISLSNMHHLLISSFKSSSNNFTSSLCYMFFFRGFDLGGRLLLFSLFYSSLQCSYAHVCLLRGPHMELQQPKQSRDLN